MSAEKPVWILSEDWAIDIDPHNWRLYPRAFDKEGKPTGWSEKRCTYYPNPMQLFTALLAKVQKQKPLDVDFMAHIQKSHDEVERMFSEWVQQVMELRRNGRREVVDRILGL